MGGFASPCRATSWSRWCSTPCSASGSITSSPETTSPACWPCPLSASWQAASSRPSNDRPAARPRAGPPRRPLVGRPCGDVRVLPRRGRPLRPRGAAEARPRGRPDRVRCAAPGPGRSSRAPDHSFDRRPLPRPRLAPAGAGYEHDDFARRFEIPIDEPANGHAHCRQLLLSAFATLMVEDGDLVLGRWQSLFAVELDGPRQRQVALQMDGEVVRRDEKVSLEALVELELARQLMVDPEPVASPMRRLVEAGGKRLRPKLVQLTAGIGPRSDPLRAAELAAAVELLHNATLIHDDYVDESTHRRGRPTVAAAEGPERAIAVGDYYFAKATRLIAQIGNGGVAAAA